MNRDYSNKIAEEVKFFTGIEVEKTPAYGKKTLFVVGVQPVDVIQQKANIEEVTHIFFGANHSFHSFMENDGYYNEDTHMQWDNMLKSFLNKGYLCSLDIPSDAVESVLEMELNEFNNFIPQIRLVIPYIKSWNYNTMVKIDDVTFNSTNPGIWTHRLHNLTDVTKFTQWDEYKNDKII